MGDYTILGTNHTSFTVSDLDRSVAFFTEALGFELLHRGGRDPRMIEAVVGVPGADIEVAYIQAPGHRLELIEYRGPADRGRVDSRPCDTGFAHVAFDVDDIDAALAAAAPYGFEPLSPPQDLAYGPNKGGRVVYTRDADGVTVEYIEPPRG
jgi:catechol 2,3-dioxygenase-like lactoylglutathione lyase family enzyme